jgi:4-hydroxy-3-polyprenylbenzoate decarboxylase
MQDLREYLDKLKEHGYLQEIDEPVHWNLEASAYCAMSNRIGSPSLHFKNVKGYPEGFSLAGSLFNGSGDLFNLKHKRKLWHRMAIGLGLDPTIGYVEFISTLNERKAHPVMPIEIAKAACKEVVQTGDDVDLFSLPFPHISKGDGGRYSVIHAVALKDYDTDWQDWGTYRLMLTSPSTMAGGFEPHTDGYKIFQKYRAAGEPMPFAVILGGPPAVTIAANMFNDPMRAEAEIAGGLNLDAIEVCKAESSELVVPAYAEVIIEGEVDPVETAWEGPFSSLGKQDLGAPQPVWHVKTITHRKDPIIPFSAEAGKPSDTMAMLSLFVSAEITRRCNEIKQYPVIWVQLPVECNLCLCVVSAPNLVGGFVNWICNYVFNQSSLMGNLFDKIILVDETLDPCNMVDLWANHHPWKAHANRDYHYIHEVPIPKGARYAKMNTRKKTRGIYIDCTWRKDWTADDIPTSALLEDSFPPELLRKVAEDWKPVYGFDMEPVIWESLLAVHEQK